MWSIQNWGVEPDIVATAKGIASGMPLGAFIARESLMTKWGPGAHGTTYGGNPLACAAALETIKLLEGGPDGQREGPRRASCWPGCASCRRAIPG